MTTKPDIVAAVAAATGQTQATLKPIVDAVFDAVGAGILKGEPVKITGLGVFSVKAMKARNGVNPRTGEKIVVTARKKVNFKLAAELKGKL